MFVKMTWTQAKEQFDAREDFVMTSGNNSNPIVLESLAEYTNMNIKFLAGKKLALARV